MDAAGLHFTPGDLVSVAIVAVSFIVRMGKTIRRQEERIERSFKSQGERIGKLEDRVATIEGAKGAKP